MNIIIKDSYPAITEDFLSEFEKENKIDLPTTYRNFLLQHNGGKPFPDLFSYKMAGKEYTERIVRFLGFNLEDTEDSDGIPLSLRFCYLYVPKTMFPIASVDGPHSVYIGVGGNERGHIYFHWTYDINMETAPDYSGFYFVADSFEEFLQNLFADD